MSDHIRIPRAGYTSMSRQLIERADKSVDVFRMAIEDALRESGMSADDAYYVQVRVIELVEVPDDSNSRSQR